VNLEVHLKKGYEPWTKLFDEDAKNRAAICDESRTTVAKVSEKLAIVILHGVRLAKFNAFVQNKDFAKMVKPYVEKHVPTVTLTLTMRERERERRKAESSFLFESIPAARRVGEGPPGVFACNRPRAGNHKGKLIALQKKKQNGLRPSKPDADCRCPLASFSSPLSWT